MTRLLYALFECFLRPVLCRKVNTVVIFLHDTVMKADIFMQERLQPRRSGISIYTDVVIGGIGGTSDIYIYQFIPQVMNW